MYGLFDTGKRGLKLLNVGRDARRRTKKELEKEKVYTDREKEAAIDNKLLGHEEKWATETGIQEGLKKKIEAEIKKEKRERKEKERKVNFGQEEAYGRWEKETKEKHEMEEALREEDKLNKSRKKDKDKKIDYGQEGAYDKWVRETESQEKVKEEQEKREKKEKQRMKKLEGKVDYGMEDAYSKWEKLENVKDKYLKEKRAEYEKEGKNELNDSNQKKLEDYKKREKKLDEQFKSQVVESKWEPASKEDIKRIMGPEEFKEREPVIITVPGVAEEKEERKESSETAGNIIPMDVNIQDVRDGKWGAFSEHYNSLSESERKRIDKNIKWNNKKYIKELLRKEKQGEFEEEEKKKEIERVEGNRLANIRSNLASGRIKRLDTINKSYKNFDWMKLRKK